MVAWSYILAWKKVSLGKLTYPSIVSCWLGGLLLRSQILKDEESFIGF